LGTLSSQSHWVLSLIFSSCDKQTVPTYRYKLLLFTSMAAVKWSAVENTYRQGHWVLSLIFYSCDKQTVPRYKLLLFTSKAAFKLSAAAEHKLES
jgi:hypothetical protein